MRPLFLVPALALLAVGCATITPREPPVLLPWQVTNATHRQVVKVGSDISRQDAVAEFETEAPTGTPLRVVDVAEPNVALPVLRDGRRIVVQLPGAWQGSRHVAVYWSDEGEIAASPTLAAKPMGGDDYATAVRGDAWDFNEGDQDGIRSWGDRPHHYGKVTVKDGLLTVPITGKDPYCIWGIMFGDPGDQPPGHADSPCENIDSGHYKRLRMRLKQSCESADWCFFFTDDKGRYQSHTFAVTGTALQTLTFDLPTIFPQFWDGRTMRAFRLDTTGDRPGATVQIDWVRIEPNPVESTVGPVVTRSEAVWRSATRDYVLVAPAFGEAGGTVGLVVHRVVGKQARLPPPAPPFVAELRTKEGALVSRAADTAGGLKNKPANLAPAVGEKARTLHWTVGLQGDLGRPAPPLKTGKITVRPAALDHYVLKPDRRFVPVDGSRRVPIRLCGADRFGNPVPVWGIVPKSTISGDGKLEARVFGGNNYGLLATCSNQPLTTHTITFSDENGIAGSCDLQTIGYRKEKVAITPTGYLTIDGQLFMPLGGFYANWPSKLPEPNGRIFRSVDLFPCGPKPYPHGFPWPAEVEEQVCTYLDLCQKHGVTALRLMLRNMDIVGRVDPVQLKATLHLFDLGRARGIRFNVALFEDYTKPPYVTADIIEKICLPHYTPEQLAALPPHRARFLVKKWVVGSAAARYLDADAIQCQKDYLDELIPVLAGREEVFCYEFENEMVRPPMAWCQEIGDYIRAIDPHTPVLGNPGPHAWPEPWRWRDAKVDLFSYHPYNNGQEGVDHGAVIFARSKWAASAGIPFYTGEGGINQSRWHEGIKRVPNEFSMRGIRDQIWLSILCGANGAFLWTADCEAEMAEFGKVLPALEAVGIDLPSLKRRTPRVVVTMPDSNKANSAAHELAYNLLSRGIDFDVRPAAEAASYPIRLDGAKPDLPADLQAEFFSPGKGWQLTSLVSKKGDQALVYLRNTAGGIQNYGKKRACWLRAPKPAIPVINILGGRWQQIRAYDLDTGQILPVQRNDSRLVLSGATFHDIVLGFVRQKEF